MTDLNPYEESLAIDLAKAQARIVGFESALRKRAIRIEELEADLEAAEQRGYANAMEAERKLHEDRIEELEAKLAQQDDLVQAAVAAKLREAHDAIAEYPRVSPDEVEAQHYDEQIDHAQAIILSLITPDAQAALDRVVAAERERGFWAGRSCGGSKAEIDAALAAIREGGE